MTCAQPSASRRRRLDHAGRRLVVAPHEHGRPGARDRRPQRAEVARAAHERHRLRIEVLAARLVQAIVEAAGDEVPVARGEAEDEQRPVRGVEDGVGHRDLGRQRRARRLRPHRGARHHDHRLEARGRVEARGLTVGADGEAAVERGRDVVGVALELGGQREHVGVELEEVIGGHEPRDVGGGARPQAAAERDLRLDAEGEALGVGEPGEAAHGEVAPVARDLEVGLHAEAPGLLDLELHVQRQRAREGVEPGAEVRAGGGHADEAAAAHRGGTLTPAVRPDLHAAA